MIYRAGISTSALNEGEQAFVRLRLELCASVIKPNL